MGDMRRERAKDNGVLFLALVLFFIWNDPILFKYYQDEIIRKCLFNDQILSVRAFCHGYACRGILVGGKTSTNIIGCNLY